MLIFSKAVKKKKNFKEIFKTVKFQKTFLDY